MKNLNKKRVVRKNPYIGSPDQPGEKPRRFGSVYKILENVKTPPIFLNRGGNFEETYYFKINTPTKINVKKPFILQPGRYIIKYGQEMCNDPKVNENLELLRKASDLKLLPKIHYLSCAVVISDFIEGVNLLKYLNEMRGETALKKYLIYAVQKEVQKWHKHKIVHGDIAVRNIMLEKNGRIWLIDPLLDSFEFDRIDFSGDAHLDERDLNAAIRLINEWVKI